MPCYQQPSVIRVMMQEPVAFLAGFFVGALGIDLSDEPLRSWLEDKQIEAGVHPAPTAPAKMCFLFCKI